MSDWRLPEASPAEKVMGAIGVIIAIVIAVFVAYVALYCAAYAVARGFHAGWG